MTPIQLVPEKVILITMASCILHNYLRSQASAHNVYTPAGSLDSEDPVTHQLHEGLWRQSSSNNGMKLIQKQGSNMYSKSAKDIREILYSYYSSNNGSVPWQYNMI